MNVCAYLNFNGNCGEAFRFYERVLGGRILMLQTHGESAARDQTPADWHDKVIHVRMAVGEHLLMGSDAGPQYYQTPQGFSVSVSFPDAATSERVFEELSDGARVTMPFQSTFWSAGFGALVDRYGTPWMINTDPAL